MSVPRPEPPAPTFYRTWWCVAAIIVAAIVAYHNTFDAPFVFDDASSIVTNPAIRKLWPLTNVLAGPATNVTAQGRPILNLSLAFNYAAGGTAVHGYHIGNLLIHVLAGLTLFGIVRRTLAWNAVMLERTPAVATGGGRAPSNPLLLALTVATLWTVHPLQTESVTYVVQRAESLVGLFYLLTFYGFIRAVERSGSHVALRREVSVPDDSETMLADADNDQPLETRRHSPDREPNFPASSPRLPPAPAFVWYSFAVIVCLLGMATKEVMVTAPLMVLLFDRTFFAGTFREAWRRRWFFHVVLAGTWLLLAWLIAQTGGNRGGSVGFGVGIRWWDYWLTQFNAIGHYLWLSVWPHPLVFEYGSFWIEEFSEIAVQVAVVLGLLAATVLALWRRSAAGFLGAWFFGILAPTSLAPGTTQMIVEHRMYLPLAAVIVMIVVAAARIGIGGVRTRSFGWVAGVIAFAFVLLTVGRNRDYRSDIALWTDTVAKRPKNPLAHFMLAGAHERAGNITAASASYEQTLELKPDFSIGHEHFAELLLRQGRRHDAIAHLSSALRLQPQYADAHANIGNAYLAEGRFSEAVGHLERAAELAPDVPMTRYHLANALAAAGLQDEAVGAYAAALRLDPVMAEAHFNLANVLLELRRAPEAIAHYEAAVKTKPGYAAAHYNLANALAASGRQQDAVEHYEAALRVRPDYAEVHHNLGSALFELGRLADAARHYEEVLRLQPKFPSVRENLERVRARMGAK
ncbi:MAG: tetratricopeptide repeat protein [Opitutaceae bacterium]|nr:tetratricopeptide repeat protein [Opitutaceae bacterium]